MQTTSSRPNLSKYNDVQWLACGSRPCRGHLSLAEAGLGPGSLCQLNLRLRGGGGDGGATGAESRISYLEMYMGKKADKARICPFLSGQIQHARLTGSLPDQVDPAEERLARFTRCSLSGDPLDPPCCADELGSLYNKDAVVAALLAKVRGLSSCLIQSCPSKIGHGHKRSWSNPMSSL